MDYKNAKHIFFYIHGLSNNGPLHGLYLKKAIEEQIEDSFVAILENNSSWIGFLTLWKTLGGIQTGGERYLPEIKKILSESENIEEISFIGSSLGGLISRYIIGELLENDKEDIDEDGDNLNEFYYEGKHIMLRNFISLASPHLGIFNVSYKYGSTLPDPILNLFQSSYEMKLNDYKNKYKNDIVEYMTEQIDEIKNKGNENNHNYDYGNMLLDRLPILVRLCTGKYLLGIERFQKRSLYCPIYNDGIVDYYSASISTKTPDDYKNKFSNKKDDDEDEDDEFGLDPIIIRAYENDSVLQVDITDCYDYYNFVCQIKEKDIIDLDKNDEFQFTQTALEFMTSKLHQINWNIIDINFDHKRLATLYEDALDGGINVVVKHIIENLI
eukprot:TRINITY_DN1374_c0_g1_i1.p1 TRINITY_DN1374_c0_g1~~TRINITY_DN1374_c0_g1_i1.p1  ORF type:complete len:384 (+),score=96.02 TRINITY_DN1374_c0_g1_i1:100-1251(+)